MLFHRRLRADADLVRAVLQGRTQQFSVLVERYQRLVYHTVLSRVSHLEDAEDLAQETFLRAFRRLDELEEPAKFGPWVRRIAENLACTALRSRRLAATTIPDWSPSTADDPVHQLEIEEEHDRVWAAIERLPLEQREVVLLFYMEGYAQDKVAAFLEVSVSAVKLRLFRARAALREDLADESDRQVAAAVRTRGQRSGGVRRVMSALPLVPWHLPVGQTLLAGGRLGWGLAVGAALGLGTLGAALGVGLWQGWWAPPAPATPSLSASSSLVAPAPAGEQDRTGDAADRAFRIVWAPPEAEATGPDGSLFGGQPLGPHARDQEREALGLGSGGRLVWDFATADPQGWCAREITSTRQWSLPATATRGVLRLDLGAYAPGRVPIYELISPEIGYDARLFDRLDVRLRVIHPTPLPGTVVLSWTTPRNRLFPGRDPRVMERLTPAELEERERQIRAGQYRTAGWYRTGGAPTTLTSKWQTLTIDGLTQERCPEWRGELVDLRLTFILTDVPLPWQVRPEEFPEAIEIDRIVLHRARPAQERSLDPPAAIAPKPSGDWLAQGSFSFLGQPGLECPLLGDLDGDGDQDLVVTFRDAIYSRQWDGWVEGWVTALNDGTSRFVLGRRQVIAAGRDDLGLRQLAGADLNQDGLLDLVVGQAKVTQTFLNQGSGLLVEDQRWEDQYLIGRGDADGNGTVDLVMIAPDTQASVDGASRGWTTRLYRNYGQALFAGEEPVAPPRSGWRPTAFDDFDGDGRAELVWQPPWSRELDDRVLLCARLGGAWQVLAEIPFRHLREKQRYYLSTPPAYLGKLLADGEWVLGVPVTAFDEVPGTCLAGMQVTGAAARLRGASWLPVKVHYRPSLKRQLPVVPQVWDLNGDGIHDPVLVDVNYRQGPCLLVMRGRRGELPAEEGRYPLPSEPRGWAVGDVDGDRRLDVVVVVEGIEGAGVRILRNAVEARPVHVAGTADHPRFE